MDHPGVPCAPTSYKRGYSHQGVQRNAARAWARYVSVHLPLFSNGFVAPRVPPRLWTAAASLSCSVCDMASEVPLPGQWEPELPFSTLKQWLDRFGFLSQYLQSILVTHPFRGCMPDFDSTEQVHPLGSPASFRFRISRGILVPKIPKNHWFRKARGYRYRKTRGSMIAVGQSESNGDSPPSGYSLSGFKPGFDIPEHVLPFGVHARF